MNLMALAWTWAWARPMVAALNLAMLALGVAAMTLLILLSEQVQHAVQRDLAGIDLVVGAKGSPLQLILSGVFHLDVPTGNIPLATLDTLRRQPLVAQAVPLSLGDSLRGFRIVGTEPAYLALYGASLAQGTAWAAPMQAVLGANVARETRLAVGQRFAGSHGLAEEGAAHADRPYQVVGVLAPCGCVLDRLVLTGLASVWAVHEHHDEPHGAEAAHDDHADEDAAREVTLVLLRYRSPLAAISLPRWVNAQAGLQAAAPALESARLLRIVGVGTDVLRALAALLLVVAAVSVFIALVHAVREREHDLATMRLLGASPGRVAALVALEALLLAALGAALGLALGHGLTQALGALLAHDRSLTVSGAWWSLDEAWLVAGTLALALLAAALPAWRAARLDVMRLLQTAG